MHTRQWAQSSLTKTVPPIPVTGAIIAGFVTVAVLYPGTRTPLRAIWYRPCQVHLKRSNVEEHIKKGSDLEEANTLKYSTSKYQKYRT